MQMALVFVIDIWLTGFLQAAAVVLHSVQVEAAVVVVVVEEAVPAVVVVDDWSSLVTVSVPSIFGLLQNHNSLTPLPRASSCVSMCDQSPMSSPSCLFQSQHSSLYRSSYDSCEIPYRILVCTTSTALRLVKDRIRHCVSEDTYSEARIRTRTPLRHYSRAAGPPRTC